MGTGRVLLKLLDADFTGVLCMDERPPTLVVGQHRKTWYPAELGADYKLPTDASKLTLPETNFGQAANRRTVLDQSTP